MFWKPFKSERILFEDSLKHIYDCEYRKVEATAQSLAGVLELQTKKVIALIEKMEREGLVYIRGDGFHLTPHGRAWALQVVRAHRLWESYLSHEVGMPLDKIHKAAEKKEHTLTPADADRLDEQLGYPSTDPHGDPIPTAAHKVDERKRGIPLVEWPLRTPGRIIHIEDEPETVFSQILSEGLLVGTNITVLASGEKGLHIQGSLHECWLAPIVAANIFVDAAGGSGKKKEGEFLSVLRPGERGRILHLTAQGLARRRFFDLGILPGTIIHAVMQSTFKEPLAYKVRDTIIALRKEQVAQILIEKLSD